MEEDPVPVWVEEGRSLLAQIISNAGVIKVEGQAEARRGLEKAEAADDIQHEANYLNSVFNQQFDPVYWNDEIIAASGIRLVNRLQVLDDQMQNLSASVVVAGERGEEEQINFIRAVSDSDSSSASALYLGAGMEIRLQAITPAYEPIMTYEQPDRLNSRESCLRTSRPRLPNSATNTSRCLRVPVVSFTFSPPERGIFGQRSTRRKQPSREAGGFKPVSRSCRPVAASLAAYA